MKSYLRAWLWGACGVLGLIGIVTVAAPKLRAAVAAALVQIVAPSRPYNATIYLSDTNWYTDGTVNSNGFTYYAGSELAVSAMTITNFTNMVQSVQIAIPYLPAGQSCGYHGSLAGWGPPFAFLVPAGTTVHFDYPTPRVFPSGCMAAVAQTMPNGGQMCINVTGFAN
jgi:hypothetical protein